MLPTTAAVGHSVVQGSSWNHPPRLALHPPALTLFSRVSICQSTCSPDEWANSSISSPLLLSIAAYQTIVKKRKPTNVVQPAAPHRQLMVHRTEIQLNSDCLRKAAQTKALLPLSLGLAGSRTNLQEHPLPGAAGRLLLDVKTYKGKSSPQMEKERKKCLAGRAKGSLAGRGVA